VHEAVPVGHGVDHVDEPGSDPFLQRLPQGPLGQVEGGAHRGGDTYLPRLDRLAPPILFLAGARNREFLPVSTARTVRLLRQADDTDLYERQVIDGYGHMDCFIGRRAAVDVLPRIGDHLTR
jgi:hypothetical protein